MKKTIYTLGMIGVISGAAYAADNYTCATPPSCASLGYTLTSTTDCIGTPLKCPFDTSKYFCTKKREVLNQFQPDWGRKKSLNTSGGYYYPSVDGMVIGSLIDIPKVGSEFRVNGHGMPMTGLEKQKSFFFSIVKSGDSVYIYGNSIQGYFVPFSGN